MKTMPESSLIAMAARFLRMALFLQFIISAVAIADEMDEDAVIEEAVTAVEEATPSAVDEREERPVPTSFPSVDTIPDSVPLYAAVRLDPWAKNIMYVMFDGNRELGYNRLYVWVPEGRQYDRPTSLTIGGDNRFPAVTWRETDGDEVVELAYVFGASRSVGMTGGGGGTHFNYLTGETTVTPPGPRRAFTNLSFSFNVDYARDKSPLGGENRLHLRIPVTLNPPTNFAGLRPSAPWNGVSFQWSIDRQTQADIDQAQLKIGGHPRVGGRGITVVSMPRGFFDIEVRVSPYLKDPVFRETVSMQELARDGLMVQVPFGWYSASWSGTTHPWIGGNDRAQRTQHLMALSRARPLAPGAAGVGQGGIGGGGPGAALRGPPPSQLRGPGNR